MRWDCVKLACRLRLRSPRYHPCVCCHCYARCIPYTGLEFALPDYDTDAQSLSARKLVHVKQRVFHFGNGDDSMFVCCDCNPAREAYINSVLPFQHGTDSSDTVLQEINDLYGDPCIHERYAIRCFCVTECSDSE